MTLFRQTNALIGKDLKIVAQRRWASTFLRAIALPIAYIIFIAYARNFFLPPSEYGFGSPRPIRDLTTEVFNSSTSLGGRDRVVFINNGYQNGQIDILIDRLSSPLRAAGADVRTLPDEDRLSEICQSSLAGFSSCYASASFTGSPTEGSPSHWSYTARIDAGLGVSVFVNQDDNAAQVYVLPFVQAIDAEIARMSGAELPTDMLEQPFTYETIQDRENDVQRFFMSALSDYLAVTLFIAICGIVFHLPGYLAVEREAGLANLVDVMSHDRRPWITVIARLASHYASFALIYLLGWLAIGIVVSELIFVRTAASIVIPFHLMLGLSLTGYSLLFGSFFRRAQLSGISALIVSLALAVVAQFAPRVLASTIPLGLLFPPATYTLFAIQLADSEHLLQGGQLDELQPWSSLDVRGYVFFVFLGVQIVVFPLLAAFVQWSLHGTSRKRVAHVRDPALALRLTNVSKTFGGFWHTKVPLLGRETVRAVDDLSLDVVSGQLVTLLGVNGSGKSTLLAGITGTLSFSQGSMELVRGTSVGFCPQRNVTWSDLTVLENLKIMAKLKTKTSADFGKDNARNLINACDLGEKIKQKPQALSGGQQRKLQLALAFAGGSKICCIDEASSGLDPLSRRKIWEIMLAQRGARTIILTTHALDEADALSDHVAIMSKGRLIAEGSSAELKHMYGGGFTVVTQANGNLNDRSLTVRGHERSSKAADIAEVRRTVESSNNDQHSTVDIRCPSIEDVFLNLAQHGSEWTTETRSSSPTTDVDIDSPSIEKNAAASSPGKGTNFFQQVMILFRKRLVVLRRNYMPHICALIVPAVVAGLGCYYFLQGFTGIPCAQRVGNDPQVLTLGALERYWGIEVPVAPADRLSYSNLPAAYYQYRSRLRLQSDYADYQAYIHNNFRDVAPGGFYVGNASDPTPLMSYRINGNPGYAGLAKNLADSYFTGVNINADFSTFQLPLTGSTGDSLQLILYITLAMCVYPAFLALYPTYERKSNVRALHYSSGVRPAPLWLAYLLFDSIVIVLVSIAVVVIFTGLSDVWYGPGYIFFALFLYGVCSTLLAYAISLACNTVLAAFAMVAGYQAVSVLIYFILYLVLLTFGSAELLQSNLEVVQFTYGLICPAGSLLRVLLLALNQSQLLCRERSFAGDPGSIEIYGGIYLYLILQSVALYGFLVCHDSFTWTQLIDRIRKPSVDTDSEKDSHVQHPSVGQEATRTQASADELRLLSLSKRFGKELAVDNVTLGVDRGEICALLGPNGAGKTSTIGLIRGDLRPSSSASSALISGHSIQREKLAAHRHLGVCPQFNATDRMTVIEHLKFYARIRGVQQVSSRVATAVKAFGLYEYRNRLVAKLSGGNQRRLSLATAMIGNPTVVLLDEMSTGVDSLAMRKMWQLISEVKSQVAIVITTHSMEEASVLSDKVAIMSKRLLTVGSPRQLRDSYTVGVYQVHIVHSKGSATTKQEMDDVLDWIVKESPGAELKRGSDSTMHGQVRCQIVFHKSPEDGEQQRRAAENQEGDRRSSHPLLTLYERLEETRQRFSVSYYSVSRPTLEDVFLDILENHD
ncbi:uncharacterized protein LTR77_003659 [Saxophila tyrrhenica]|uniref:ABC transporter domain-containing protein n=1 Tax=Saxophila tyrrhenica TaxID=1690608 RepID=A0AAV9PIH0_9PEZI|nr:hypothetical protein LTR77_003659 [Saxophila tyrrhenica]